MAVTLGVLSDDVEELAVEDSEFVFGLSVLVLRQAGRITSAQKKKLNFINLKLTKGRGYL